MYKIGTYLKKISRQRPIELKEFWVSFTCFSSKL